MSAALSRISRLTLLAVLVGVWVWVYVCVCLRAQGDVLEISAGTGRNLPYYPMNNIRSLTLCDISRPMLDKAEDKCVCACARACVCVQVRLFA